MLLLLHQNKGSSSGKSEILYLVEQLLTLEHYSRLKSFPIRFYCFIVVFCFGFFPLAFVLSTHEYLCTFFNREECDRLIEIMNSRVAEYSMNEGADTTPSKILNTNNITVAFDIEYGLILCLFNHKQRAHILVDKPSWKQEK